MTNATYIRKTERTVDLSAEPDPTGFVREVRIRKSYSDAHFRPTQIVEKLHEHVWRDGTSDAGYAVEISGPVVTSKGKDHVGLRLHGNRTWIGAELYGGNSEPFPESLRRFLVGPEALREWSR